MKKLLLIFGFLIYSLIGISQITNVTDFRVLNAQNLNMDTTYINKSVGLMPKGWNPTQILIVDTVGSTESHDVVICKKKLGNSWVGLEKTTYADFLNLLLEYENECYNDTTKVVSHECPNNTQGCTIYHTWYKTIRKQPTFADFLKWVAIKEK